MAKYCSFDCAFTGPVCDFCKHYNFNGDSLGRYTGEGYCKLTMKQMDPEQGSNCNDFYCRTIDKKKEEENV